MTTLKSIVDLFARGLLLVCYSVSSKQQEVHTATPPIVVGSHSRNASSKHVFTSAVVCVCVKDMDANRCTVMCWALIAWWWVMNISPTMQFHRRSPAFRFVPKHNSFDCMEFSVHLFGHIFSVFLFSTFPLFIFYFFFSMIKIKRHASPLLRMETLTFLLLHNIINWIIYCFFALHITFRLFCLNNIE